MRGGIAEKGGIRVGHRIIEINGQSVVATPHEKIIQLLTQAVSEVSGARAGRWPGSRGGCGCARSGPGSQLCPSTLQPGVWGLPADGCVSAQVHIKTMPASTYRLLTGQEQPLFL